MALDTFDISQLANQLANSPSANSNLKANAQLYLSGKISAETFFQSAIYYFSLSATGSLTFEQWFPKQTSQLIKIGQDLTYFGQKVTQIDSTIADFKDLYEKRNAEVSGQLVDLGESISGINDRISGLGSNNGGNDGGIGGFLGGIGTGGLLVGGLVLFLLLRSRK